MTHPAVPPPTMTKSNEFTSSAESALVVIMNDVKLSVLFERLSSLLEVAAVQKK